MKSSGFVLPKKTQLYQTKREEEKKKHIIRITLTTLNTLIIIILKITDTFD